MSHLPWLTQAESDLDAAKVLSGSGFHSQAVWFAGQAVEKGYKAILAALGIRYEEKHFKQLGHSTSDIAKMLPMALHEPVDEAIAGMVSRIESRSQTCRYPQPIGSLAVAPTKSFSRSTEDVANAGVLLDWCRERIARAITAVAAMKP